MLERKRNFDEMTINSTREFMNVESETCNFMEYTVLNPLKLDNRYNY